jgi:hypothetical protein
VNGRAAKRDARVSKRSALCFKTVMRGGRGWSRFGEAPVFA